MVEFWEDYYHDHPLESHRQEDGHIVFETGDPLIDKWEQQIARGEKPDLTEAFSPDELRRIQATLRRAKSGKTTSIGGRSQTFGDTVEEVQKQVLKREQEWKRARFPRRQDS